MTGDATLPLTDTHRKEVTEMRIHVGKRSEAGQDVLVVPSRRVHKAPFVTHLEPGERVKDRLASAIEELDREERAAREAVSEAPE